MLTIARELARYRVDNTERVLQLEQQEAAMRLVDSPASAGGASYVVDSDLHLDGEASISALVADYLAQARRMGVVPMTEARLRSLLGSADRDA
jgi:hypothetical protein